MLNQNILVNELSKCCELDCFSIELCSEDEKYKIKDLMPTAKTIMVLAHQIKNPIEWLWFSMESERNNVTCPADLHAKIECQKLMQKLLKNNFKSFLVPYPGSSGIIFKSLANKSGLGKIGDNFLFLHREWGAWTHLRILLTDAEIINNLPHVDNVCIHCGNCKKNCMAKAITDNFFIGTNCSKYLERKNEKYGIKDNYFYKCEDCIRVCPIGYKLPKIRIKL